MAKNVFISYRRDGGEALAQLLHDRLSAKGFPVFYDIETLGSGNFNVKLLKAIEESDCVVLVLPPRALDRCIYEEDYVRKEIAHALKLGKVIVPVMMRGFEFPHDLPEDIADVRLKNGVRFDDMSFLDAKINRIIELFEPSESEMAEMTGSTGKHSGPSLIANVCSIGACDPENCWPKGTYSTTISSDVHSVVFFHAVLVRPYLKQTQAPVGYYIYNSRGALVGEHKMTLTFQPGNNKFSIGWILRSEDGGFVQAGDYRVEMWIDNSRVYEYRFRVTNTDDLGQFAAGRGVGERARQEMTGRQQMESFHLVENRIAELEKKLTRPKGLLIAVLELVAVAAMHLSPDMDLPGVMPLSLLAFLVTMVWLVVYTRKNVTKGYFSAFLLAFPLFYFYAVYLLVTALHTMAHQHAWRLELERLKASLK